MGKVIISTSILFLMSIPAVLDGEGLFLFLFLVFFVISGYFSHPEWTQTRKFLGVFQNALCILVSFVLMIFMVFVNGLTVPWFILITAFGICYFCFKPKFMVWAGVWILFSLLVAVALELRAYELMENFDPFVALICLPILFIKLLDILALRLELKSRIAS